MSGWSPDRSSLLSLLLDEVTGTQEQIEIRQDYAMMMECMPLIKTWGKVYYTGSRAEGLDLPGSDDDFMMDFNNLFNVKVIQSTNKTSDMSSNTILYLRTENVRPGFALLEIPRVPPLLRMFIEKIKGVQYLSSNLMAQCLFDSTQESKMGIFFKRQGPSLENNMFSSMQLVNQIEGTDLVLSIHCDFWPNEASEWKVRPRKFGWPAPLILSSIVNFGFHLVAIGHPHSETKLTEWRISFSMAERTLVWSFNHVQMQCYAVMKIILKEFIKKKCSPKNQVLCSYFIKTFLFWKFETTDTNFWQQNKFRECIRCSITEFAQSLHDGVLRHYFIPRFNLLSVKLTREAQRELLQLYDIVIQYDISILKECKTFQHVWSKFLSADENQISIRRNALKTYFIKNDELILQKCIELVSVSSNHNSENYMKPFSGEDLFNHLAGTWLLMTGVRTTRKHVISSISSLPCKSHLKTLIFKQILWDKYLKSVIQLHPGKNKMMYKIHHAAHNESSTFDLSTNKIWYAIMLMSTRDFSSALSIVNNVLSSIPPFYLCASYHRTYSRRMAEELYADKFMNSGLPVIKRAREAWFMPLMFKNYMINVVPLAIQIELYFYSSIFCDCVPVKVSPFAMLHYLAFQCYHELGQYDHRDNALCNLLDAVHAEELINGYPHESLNIAGHCLLIAGDIDKARRMFTLSKQRATEFSEFFSVTYTAAAWYLQHFC